MKVNTRYVQVFVLYLISVITSNIVTNSNSLIKTLVQTLTGFTVFSIGLRYLTKRKQKKA
ncbi:hypothetical protein [Staphylococcus simiae]|uniref:Uncharacterized protein n=1 Tax=Staphylococcus simiae CCM 7213 = CCUG 51256 TaxID=911238 RepID=G5JH25_9STAP|nr:hypothetical protein [Staphylococcus simiae]EHJ08512.1 hypothetical protein SS7213T_03770 [Staphylococcus simiae CCM 7213 = CCUG 51256]MBO1199861.1 hypothetical protein [Staphylococcus simiae]MBO1202288.1 hypothetical protein [Staphylococcus simiae]MBO1204544.1 hypothetical protein [Staphylococcus simiae]MBO1211920.1 hypothetical protein [Staphylococcus simiae]